MSIPSTTVVERDLLDAQRRLEDAQTTLLLAAEERAQAIRTALEAGYSQTEVAGVLGITLAAVNNALATSRKRVRP